VSERSRYPAALLIVLLILAVVAWGCGDAEEATTSTEGTVPTTVTTVATPGGTQALIGTQPRTTPNTPVEYTDAVEQGRPVVILFYVPAGVDDQRVLESISLLQGSFPDYTFLLYDFSVPGPYGDLPTLLQVDYPPAVILVDDTGTIDAAWNGFVDEGTLNQELVNLGV
jgi:hypothetical protein